MAIHYRTQAIDGVSIFYREAGPAAAPTLVLLHGFPASSHMFRDLIPQLASHYHVIAPDYPGFGYSDAPTPAEFSYTFDHLTDVMHQFLTTLGLTRFAIYVQDYGAPIGFRIAHAHPEAITAIITQNGNAYEEGFTPFWEPIRAISAHWTPETEAPVRALLTAESTRWQYTSGMRDMTTVSPDAWTLDQHLLDRPGNGDIQVRLLADYQNNRPLYPAWQAYFREHQPPTLVIWGKNDPIFGADGARAFARDLPQSELHLLDTGHFALEEEGDVIATHIRRFLKAHLATSPRL
jgi:pimeloyl-ACP methyl ester carboxylesterase